MNRPDSDWLYNSKEFQNFFQRSSRSLVIKVNSPCFTVMAVSDSYLALTHRQRHEVVNKNLLELFSNTNDNLLAKDKILLSFQRVLETKNTDILPTFVIEVFVSGTGRSELLNLTSLNEPILDEEGKVAYIVNSSFNVAGQFTSQFALGKIKEQNEAFYREQQLNEELAASNEELSATNEELHLAQDRLYQLNSELEGRVARRTQALTESEEALQRMNEELTATNEELASINEEQSAINEELLSIQKELQIETANKQKAIERLEANEKSIRNMVRQAPVGMCIVQGDPLYVVETNDSFLEIIGKQREQFYDTPYWEVNSEAKAYYEPITTNVLRTGTTYHAKEHEILLIRKGKPETVHVDFVYEPMKDEQGYPYAIIIVAIEVTEQVASRRKIEQAEESLRMATESAGLGTWSFYPKSGKLVTSARFNEIFGLLPREIMSMQVKIAQIHPDYRQYVQDALQISFDSGILLNIEYPVIQRNGGKERWVRVLGKLIKGSKDNENYLTGVTGDITEQKQDEQRKNDFIGMVSHELKTPLTSMSAYLQLLQIKAKDNKDGFTGQVAGKAGKQVLKMTNLINGFLNVSRLESGKIQIDMQRFDMAQLVKEAEEEVLSTINSHRIIIAPVEMTYVVADREKISQVISNFISNAVKYSPSNSTIQIACITADGMAVVSVEDEGIGVQPKDRDKLFGRYYRVENNNTKSIAGFGIGLYLCAEIIKRHKGKIWVESEIGKGSTFFFSLPLIK